MNISYTKYTIQSLFSASTSMNISYTIYCPSSQLKAPWISLILYSTIYCPSCTPTLNCWHQLKILQPGSRPRLTIQCYFEYTVLSTLSILFFYGCPADSFSLSPLCIPGAHITHLASKGYIQKVHLSLSLSNTSSLSLVFRPLLKEIKQAGSRRIILDCAPENIQV